MIAYATRTYASKQYQTFLSLVLMHVPLILIKNLICVFKCHTALVDNHQAFLNGASRSLRRGGRLHFLRWSGDAADVFGVFLNSPPANLAELF